MDKNTTAIAKQVRLSQWAADIRDCKSRPTNVTVDDWCKNHGITKATYYWRLNAVRKACIESVETQTNVVDSSPTFVELKPPVPIPAKDALVSVHIGDATIEFSENISDEFLIRILKAVAYVK